LRAVPLAPVPVTGPPTGVARGRGSRPFVNVAVDPRWSASWPRQSNDWSGRLVARVLVLARTSHFTGDPGTVQAIASPLMITVRRRDSFRDVGEPDAPRLRHITPDNGQTGLGAVLLVNDDVLAPATISLLHEHCDLEAATYVAEGTYVNVDAD